MRLGEILDGSFNIFRRHFGLFMRMSLILVWLPTAIGIYLNLRFSNNPFALLSVFQENLGRSIGITLLVIVVWVACGLLLTAGTIRTISDSYLGQEPELMESLRFGLSKIGPLVVVALSKGLLVVLLYATSALGVGVLWFMGKLLGPAMAGLMIFVGIIGAAWFVIWVMCAYGTTTPIVVLEELNSSFEAFGRSWELTRGARGKVFGTVVVTWLISQAVPGMVINTVGSVVGIAGNEALQPVFVVLASLMGIVLAPIMPCAITLLYYDLRVRREAFDLQVLSEQLGGTGTGSGTMGTPGTH
jgi:hypothetical protein